MIFNLTGAGGGALKQISGTCPSGRYVQIICQTLVPHVIVADSALSVKGSENASVLSGSTVTDVIAVKPTTAGGHAGFAKSGGGQFAFDVAGAWETAPTINYISNSYNIYVD